MGQTITEKIFSEHVGKAVYAGGIIRCNIDMVIGNDITTPISIKAFEDSGATKLANPDGFSSFVFDSDFFTINFGAWRTEDEIKQVVAALRSAFNKG